MTVSRESTKRARPLSWSRQFLVGHEMPRCLVATGSPPDPTDGSKKWHISGLFCAAGSSPLPGTLVLLPIDRHLFRDVSAELRRQYAQAHVLNPDRTVGWPRSSGPTIADLTSRFGSMAAVSGCRRRCSRSR